MTKYTVLRDTREKEDKGWWFPASQYCYGTQEQALKTGDYTLLGYENVLCIERKGGVNEFASNVCQERFTRELERMRAYRFAFILLEFSMEQLMLYPKASGVPIYKRRSIKITGSFILKRYIEICQEFPTIHIILCGDTRGRDIASSIFKRTLEKLSGEFTGQDTVSDDVA